jgi:hypothetical protein
VNAGQLKTKRWTNSGAPLRGFQNVDQIGLHILAAETRPRSTSASRTSPPADSAGASKGQLVR